MQRVKFLQHFSPYNVGEIACFGEQETGRLIKRGIVGLVTDTPAVEKDVPEQLQMAAAGETAGTAAPAGEIDDEDLESPTKGRGKGKKS